MLPILQHTGYMEQHPSNPSSASMLSYNMSPMLGLPTGPSHNAQLVIREPQQQLHHQQMLDAQQLAAVVAAREQQEMMRTYEQQQHRQQHELLRFNSGFDPAGQVSASGFNQMTAAAMSPSLALGSFENSYQIQQQPQEHTHHHQLQLQPHLLLHQQQQQQPQQQQAPQQQRSGSEEGRSVGPSC
ncbi:hypothetical protein F0562_003912 [Nyssa sinensis]|uniref:Uncharacterized protein n=1 Tax=Nyssa sinensis TaxID=561372 RepID=A0A5J5BX30_9ASTE|nr:hypothetical protein F0562_003912 [Nyssa sinensis]